MKKDEEHKRYLELLRARHERERAELRTALAGRRPRALQAIERQQRQVETETAKILENVSEREA